jgi:hypothetical protein
MRLLLIAGLSALALGAPAETFAAEAEENRLEADVRFLADDLMEGREAGTRGFDLAAKFVAERYRALGLAPGGDDQSYFQTIPFRKVSVANDTGGTMRLSGRGAPRLKQGADYVVGSSGKAESVSIEGEVVFVGYGFVSAEHERDDYAGLDVEGKIVAYFSGAPKFLNSEERAHNRSLRAQNASERGAIGAITIWTPELEDRFAFERAASRVGVGSSMNWVDDNGEAFSTAPNLRATASISMDAGRKLLARAPVSYDDLVAASEADAGEVPAFPLGVTARIETKSVHSDTTSPNVIGILPGSDPALANEYIVVTAHLDHIGIRPPREEGGDEINNGAVDNATGIASMLEAARLLKQNPPRRPVMFIALTAEEKGLEGSDYFARKPTVPKEQVVANINLDMPMITYDFADIVAFGAERSTMYPVVEAAAGRAGLALSPDPQPEQGFFTRSDQYSFVKQGVPAINIDIGWANGGEEAQEDFLKNHYHKASDEADIVHYGALQRFAQVNYEVIRGVADMDERPLWKKGDFFGTTFDGPMEE